MENRKISIHLKFSSICFIAYYLFGCLALSYNPICIGCYGFDYLKDFYITSIGGAFFVFFYIELVDIYKSARGSNGEFFTKYFDNIKSELFSCLMLSLFLVVIFWFDGIPYDNRGIDIGVAGLSFLVPSLLGLMGELNKKILGRKVNAKVLFFQLAVLLIYLLFSIFFSN